MKSVAIIIQNLYGGGAERVAANLSRQLSESYHVHLIVFNGESVSYPYGGTLHNLNLKSAGGFFQKIRNIIMRVKRTREIKRRENVDVSISLMDGANLINIFSRAHDKAIISVRDNMSETYPSRFRKIIERLVIGYTAKRSNYLVAVSDDVADDLIRNFGVSPQKTTVIYNWCDADALKKAATNQSASHALPPFAVCTMGRLVPQKGQWHLIRAFKAVLRDCPDATLHILGRGPLESDLKRICAELEISGSVFFEGFVKAPHQMIRNAKAFVLPSLHEGMSNALLEMMAFGVPCIATDCHSGSREVIAPDTKFRGELDKVEYCEYGILTSVGDNSHMNATEPLTKDEAQLAEAILAMLKNEELRKKYAEASLERSRRFSPERILEDWIRIIES